ncbi:substrate-binding domain-containing protein [Alcaligenes aquatilis]|uniref:Phosphate-binding protein PstS n=1 Tax=Alcaligenes aquatilis TaxID=323284 RepID=A0A3G2HR61_9BURK|nr:substrate-binding domain-containing protein [Alcaligenes aquatilis]AYN19509.1 alkaline phosphatase [Alcaligenes aquatilis]
MKTFKLKALSAVVAVGMMIGASAASAQVIGGGATLPEDLYNDLFTTAPLPGFAPYVGTGSGKGKTAFFTNEGAVFNAPGQTVDYAGSDSLIDQSNVDGYDDAAYGALIFIPSVLTSVTVPYNLPSLPSIDLNSEQLAGIFDGTYTNWNQVGGPNQPITVVYRSESSGTSEIFTRHLAEIDDDFVTDSTFYKALGKSSVSELPSNFQGATGSNGVVAAVNQTVGAIGYVSPDKIDADFNKPVELAAKVARINGLLPTEVNVQAAIEEVPVPSTEAQRRNPLAWGISNPNPSAGYPIVASTNLILSQCYQAAADNTRIRDMLNKLYGTAGTWDSEVTEHGFIPLPTAWKEAIHQTFWNQSDSLDLAVGNSAECTSGRGRPS